MSKNKIYMSFTDGGKVNVQIYFTTDYFHSILKCSFISEDIDYGTETIEYTAETTASFLWCAEELRDDIEHYLENTCEGTVRKGWDAEKFEQKYGDYNNSTLIAVVNALNKVIWNGAHLKNDSGEKVKITSFLHDYTNILTGNFYNIEKGTIGKIVATNNRRAWCNKYENIYLVELDGMLDYQTKEPIQIWVSGLAIECIEEE